MLFVELIVVLRKFHSYMDGPLIIIYIPTKIKQLKRKYVMEGRLFTRLEYVCQCSSGCFSNNFSC